MQESKLRGWLYVLTNAAMPGLVKVGKSGRDPIGRSHELSGTGHPDAFKLEFDALVLGYHELELAVHSELAQSRYVGTGRGSEFFACGALVAVQAIRRVCTDRILIESVSDSLQKLFDEERRSAEEKEELVRLRNEVEILRRLRDPRNENTSPIGLGENPRVNSPNESRELWLEGQRILINRMIMSERYKADLLVEVAANKKCFCPKCTQVHFFFTGHAGEVVCKHCGYVFWMPPK